ncbi:pinensin family lanthipeptide [Fulvivirga sp. 29W222]|uniref:Pinensin family lanthipeptide n=1 Tax=Fulvivirga marina TaxID=2494733 RepID=A0A937G065_9BACT|nr:pinensin family lanthipeptide [Fulvivirga marina]MBL6447711.1 pinensin family lanthipeptide [Fulvivirga marina]
MKKKLKLKDLRVKSFITLDKIRGGANICTGCDSTCGIQPATGTVCE